MPKQLAYACGMLGWSIMINIISVMLIYFYLPPTKSGLVNLVPQLTILGIFNAMALIASSGRLVDAITDPLIAFYSDNSRHPKGRRIPFMRYGVLPSLVFCVLIFVPLSNTAGVTNVVWLTVTLVAFFFSLTVYIIPYNALLPELAETSAEKLKLSTWLSMAFVIGIVISSQTPILADLIQEQLSLPSRMRAIQYAIGSWSILAFVFMLIPIIAIDEKRYCESKPATIPLRKALKQTFTNRNFVLFIIADCAYFMAIAIITSGLLYYVTVLLRLEESIGGKLMGAMVVVSLLFYPLINWLALKWGKKPLVIFSFFLFSLIFLGVFYLGKFSVAPTTQAYLFAISCAFPLAALGILPYAILAEIAEADGLVTGQHKEGMYFAVRNFFDKVGQTLGIMLFAILTLYGKDPGHDWGIRLNGIFGFVLCFLAALAFFGFKEKSLAIKTP